MKRPVLLAIAVFALGAACVAPAKSASPTPVPDVRPDLSPMAMFLGTWSCKALKSTNSRVVGHVFTASTAMAFDGRWMQTDQTTPPFDQYRTRDFVLKTWLTYDTVTKMWVGMTVDNLGGYGLTTSPGWTGNTLVTSDKLISNGGSLGVDTVTKLNDNHYHDLYEVKTPKGNQFTESDCTKSM